ncbi:MAG TPA: DUF4915 domain-containing protein [bacterium]|jgi:uncharacterized protein (TIGR03032 family)|nr:DUF4915 domain-containing protein [bacterium]
MKAKLGDPWEVQQRQWRDPAQVAAQWEEAGNLDPRLLECEVEGPFWRTLAAAGVTVLLTREYEHLVVALGAPRGRPRISYLRLPHPSGLAVDRKRGIVHVASTRNPNQVYDLAPASGMQARLDSPRGGSPGPVLLPRRVRFYPGSCYFHDLALIQGRLHANAVGHNAVVRLPDEGGFKRVWWPRCIDRENGPLFGRNHLQLNSIAAGPDLAGSFFSASSGMIRGTRPGDIKFPVDGTGVIFSGRTREVLASGLTRPHSARLRHGRLWVDNSGYGEVGVIRDGRLEVLRRLPGWTRGLGFWGGLALVGTSRVIPRFRAYAPGLDVDASRCGLHLLDAKDGRSLGSLYWPYGNQIFAIEAVPESFTTGLPFDAQRPDPEAAKRLFYAYQA